MFYDNSHVIAGVDTLRTVHSHIQYGGGSSGLLFFIKKSQAQTLVNCIDLDDCYVGCPRRALYDRLL